MEEVRINYRSTRIFLKGRSTRDEPPSIHTLQVGLETCEVKIQESGGLRDSNSRTYDDKNRHSGQKPLDLNIESNVEFDGDFSTLKVLPDTDSAYDCLSHTFRELATLECIHEFGLPARVSEWPNRVDPRC